MILLLLLLLLLLIIIIVILMIIVIIIMIGTFLWIFNNSVFVGIIKLSNRRIIWLEETHLNYQFVNAFLDRIRWAMLNFWDKFFHGKVRVRKFDVRISCLFIRLILPVFFFEVVSCTKNDEHEPKKLNTNDDNGKIIETYPFYLQNCFSKKRVCD